MLVPPSRPLNDARAGPLPDPTREPARESRWLPSAAVVVGAGLAAGRPAIWPTGRRGLRHHLVDAVGHPLLRSLDLVGRDAAGGGLLVDAGARRLLQGVRDGSRIDVVGLGDLGQRLALELLAKLVDGDAERLGRRVEAAAHVLLPAGPLVAAGAAAPLHPRAASRAAALLHPRAAPIRHA